jgi:hypothetical protein
MDWAELLDRRETPGRAASSTTCFSPKRVTDENSCTDISPKHPATTHASRSRGRVRGRRCLRSGHGPPSFGLLAAEEKRIVVVLHSVWSLQQWQPLEAISDDEKEDGQSIPFCAGSIKIKPFGRSGVKVIASGTVICCTY